MLTNSALYDDLFYAMLVEGGDALNINRKVV
jgi:hypothetical protein